MKINRVIFSVLTGVLLQFPAIGKTQDVVSVKFDSVEKYNVTWEDTSKLMNKFYELGYMNIQINDLKYNFKCPCCEKIEIYESDPINLNSTEMIQIHEWCKKHKGKYLEVWIGDDIKFTEVEKVVTVLNQYDFTFYLSLGKSPNEFEIDLYGTRKKSQPAGGGYRENAD